MVVFTEFLESTFDIVEDKKSDGYMRVRGRFQASNKKNANGRIYPNELWERVLAEDRVTNMLESRRMLGCVEHPTSGQTHLSNVSHIVTGLSRKGDDIIGEAEILNTPSGMIIQELLRRKVPIGISSRGKGTSSMRNGVEYVNPDDFILETFDFVYKPSTPEAFPQLQESVLEGSPFARNTPMAIKIDTIKKYDVRAGEINEAASGKLRLADLHKLLSECQEMRNSVPGIVSSLDGKDAEHKTYIESVSERLEATHQMLIGKLDSVYVESDLNRRVDTALDNKKGGKDDDLVRELLAEARQENDYLRGRLDDVSSLLEASTDDIVRRYNAASALANETLERLQEALGALAEVSGEHEALQERYSAAVELVAGFTESQQEGKIALTIQEAIEQFPGLTKFEKILRSCKTEDDLVERVNDLVEAEGLTKAESSTSSDVSARLSFAAAINEDGGAPDSDEVVSESVLPKKGKKAAKDARRVSGDKILQESATATGREDDERLEILEGLLEATGGQ